MKKLAVTCMLGGALVLGVSTIYTQATSDGEMKPNEHILEVDLVDSTSKVKLLAHKEKDSKEIEADVTIDPKDLSLKELKKYVNKMPYYYKKLEKQGHESVESTITLNEPISYEQFAELVSTYNIQVSRIYAATVFEDGSEGGLTVALDDHNQIPMEKIHSLANGPVKQEVEGIYAFNATINVKDSTFNDLSSHEDVFLVDVSHNYIKETLEGSDKIKKLKANDSKHTIDINVYDLYWELQQVTKDSN
ncbi:hypothetical protein FZW96_07570 [Bacillus sp. BGMRC 2118]|nr:hypothetical protein FZW96_07570 [Bacillus sp. BGMRC 2118]